MQQIDNGKIGRRLSMGNRERLQHRPTRLILCLELQEQPRLSGAGLGDCGDNLSAAGLGALGCVAHCLHLALTPDEFRQSAPCCALKARAQRSQPRHFVNGDLFADAFDPGGPQRLECEVSFN